MSEKLQKVLARAGHGSRREIEAIIEAGRVSVDGKIATLGDRVEIVPGLKIRIDGHLISVKESAEQDLSRAGVLQTGRRAVYPQRSGRAPDGV